MARKSMGGARQSSLGRKSQGARTSTIGNGGATTHVSSGPRSDPRPITDKGFMNASIRSLLNYLIAHNYDSTISPKILARPSSKDFNNIVTFLLRKVDRNFNDGTIKFEDEVSLAFKVSLLKRCANCCSLRFVALVLFEGGRLFRGLLQSRPCNHIKH